MRIGHTQIIRHVMVRRRCEGVYQWSFGCVRLRLPVVIASSFTNPPRLTGTDLEYSKGGNIEVNQIWPLTNAQPRLSRRGNLNNTFATPSSFPFRAYIGMSPGRLFGSRSLPLRVTYTTYLYLGCINTLLHPPLFPSAPRGYAVQERAGGP